MALYDPTAAALLVEPACGELRPVHLVMELEGRHTRGMTVAELRIPRRATANAQAAGTMDEAAVRRIVLDALAQA
jgi:inosine-uridine nucleoside N-ribohydrolase